MGDDKDIGRQPSIPGLFKKNAEGETVCIEGTVDRIVYENSENGFFVARLRSQQHPDRITFVGNLLAVSTGEQIRLWGRWVDDKQYGRQLRVERYETLVPNSVRGIRKYLGSGLIPGIGPELAKRLVAAFGAETLRVIAEEPERLMRVDGIGPKRAALIREAWGAQRAIQSIMVFLQGHGIGTAHAIKIYKHYGDGAVAVLRENPYRLADDIAGIAFKTADAIATELGISKDSPQRLRAGTLYVLQQAAGEGHVYLPEEELRSRAAEILDVAPEMLDAATASLIEHRQAIRETFGEPLRAAMFPSALHAAEVGCAELLSRLIHAPAPPTPIHVEKAIEWVERTQEVRLSAEQREAIRIAVSAKVMVITGGPGTGKTTLVKALLRIFEKKGLCVLLGAPTGRAAKRLENATDRTARTIHRMLEFSPKEGGFLRNEADPLRADLVVLDEASMIDTHLMHHLLRALELHTRLILVGDVDQLPSVGPGNILLDVISSQTVPVVWLKTVFRQAAQSGIVTNAHRINSGQFPEFNRADFFFVQRKEPEAARNTLLDLVTKRIPNKFGFDPVRDIQVLAPMHRGEIGVAKLNETLRAALNPSNAPIPRRSFGLGDKVMQLRNNYELEVFNGDIGLVVVVDEEAQELQVRFEDDREVIYPFELLDELQLAYAGTVHKAQGCEYPAVVLPLLTQHYVMLHRNVLYTAVTRARRLVVIVGDPRALALAVRNTSVSRRYTRLAERLRLMK